MLRTSTRVDGSRLTICWIASTPPSCGIARSRMTRSGFNSNAWRTASRPSEASPITSHPRCVSRILRSPSRTRVWSSANRIRMADISSPRGQWQFDRQTRPFSALSLDAEPAAQILDALADADQPEAVARHPAVRHRDLPSDPVIFRPGDERRGDALHEDPARAGLRVSRHVRQRFLDDSINADLDVDRESFAE